MSASILNSHQIALALLAATIEQNAAYVAAFGYPTGRACQYCGKEVFANPQVLEQLATAAAGSNLAHDHCHEIATLRAALGESEKQRPITLTMVELPKRPEPDPIDLARTAGRPKEGSDAGS